MNKKNTKYLTIALIIIIIIMGLAFPLFLAKSRLASAVSELRKEGFPVTPQEFADKYYKPIPQEQNAAATFKRACSLLRKPTDPKFLIVHDRTKTPRLNEKLSPELLATAKEYIEQNIDFFNELEKTQKYDFMHFDYKWEDGFRMEMRELGKSRDASRIYAIKIELAITDEAPQQAYELLKKIFHFNALASKNPTIIGQMVFYACNNIALAELERCMNTLSFSSEQLKSFYNIFDKHEQLTIKRWPAVWGSELLLILSLDNLETLNGSGLFPNMSSSYRDYLPKKLRVAFYYYSGSSTRNLVPQVKAVKELIKIPVDIYVKRKLQLEKIRDNCKGKHPWILGVNVILYQRILEMMARLRCAKTACAVQRFRLKYGKLPEKLSQLVPEFLAKVPIDPFDGKDLRYFHGNFDVQYEISSIPQKETGEMFGADIIYKPVIIKKKGFYIYSVSKDLIDNKGDLLVINNYKKKDITFIVIDKK